MIVYIKKVDVSNIDNSAPYEKILEFKILCMLKSRREIEILDEELLDLRKYEEKSVECLIYIGEGSLGVKDTIEGDFIKEIIIPKDKIEKYIFPESMTKDYEVIQNFLSKHKGIKTKDGIFIISPETKYRKGQRVKYRVGGYRLMAWYPIEE